MSERTEEVIVPPDAAGMRLDTFLSRRQSEFSRTYFQQLIKDGAVTVNGDVPRRSMVVEGGETIVVRFPPAENPWPQPQDLPLEVLHHDDHIIIVNKAAGMIVHPAAGNPDGTLVNALLHHFPNLPGINGIKRPGIVHRLDRDTSGVMVVAQTDAAMRALARDIQRRLVQRLYVALIIGEPDWTARTVVAAVGRCETNRLKRAIDGPGARPAATHFTVLARARGFTLVKCRLETGRTHQIRIHCSHIGHPIAGDWLYGGGTEQMLERLRHADSSVRRAFQKLERPFLHARLLRLRHPVGGEWRAFTAPLPPELAGVAQTLYPELDVEDLLRREVDEAPVDTSRILPLVGIDAEDAEEES